MPAGQILRLCSRDCSSCNRRTSPTSRSSRRLKQIGIEPGKSFDLDKARPRHPEGAGNRAGRRAEADGVESPDPGARRQRLVDEHRHDGRLRQLLSEARDRRAIRPRRECSRGCHLSDQSRRRVPASRSTAPITTRSISTRTPLRQLQAFWSITLYDAEGYPGRKPAQPFARQQLDAVRLQCRRLARSLFPEREPRRRQGSELAARAQGSVQSVRMRIYAPKSDALTGKWNPPPVKQLQGLPGLEAQ